MGSWCGASPQTVTQNQTYNPDPFAKGMIQNALTMAGNVAQTPFQTPQAPVAGFSGQQNQAFNLANNVPGAAQPYIDQANRYLSGQGVGDFYNPMSANVLAGLKDIFGQQMSDTTGKLTNAAGGVGADRIAVGQSELAKEQGLTAGQTLANLWQPAVSAAQSAGYGMANLGNLNQQTQMQGVNQLLTTGGLQQQLQQAQMNAPYQQQLAQIQWPYQNAQFLAGITGALAPGMGSQQIGATTYPGANPFGTIAGLGMAGAGAYGAYNSQQPQQQAARGGRIGYAGGGDVGLLTRPIDISDRALIPNVQMQPIHAPTPLAQTQAPSAATSPGALGIGKDLMSVYGAGKGVGSLFGKSAPGVEHEAAPLGGMSEADALAADAAPDAATGAGLWDTLGGYGSGAWDALSGAGTAAAESVGGALSGIGEGLAAILPFFGIPLSNGGRAANPYSYADGGATPQQQMPLTQAAGMLGSPGMASAFASGAFSPQAKPQPIMPQMPMSQAGQMLGFPGSPALYNAMQNRGFSPFGWGGDHRSWGGQHQWGGRQTYADGGSVDHPLFPGGDPSGNDEPPWLEGLRRARETSDITRIVPPMFDWTNAMLGVSPRSVHVWPGMSKMSPALAPPQGVPTGGQRMQIRGRFQRAGTDVNHPAQDFGEAYLGSNLGAHLARSMEDPIGAYHGRREIPEDSVPMIQRGVPEDSNPEISRPASFADRWGDMPYHGDFGMMRAPAPSEFGMMRRSAPRLPLPRANPFAIRRELEEEEPPRRMVLRGHASGFAEGGDVDFPDEPVEPVTSPFTRQQAALEEASPFERAALRTRETVRPTRGRQDGPLMGLAGTALALGLSPEAALASYAPRAAAAMYGLMGGMTPTEAGNAEFKWTDPNSDRTKRLDKIDSEIALESSRKTPSAAGTQKARIDSLAAEKALLLKARDADYASARKAHEDELERLQQEALEKKKAETSFFDMIPGSRAALTTVSPFASYFGGKYLGKRLSPWAAIPVGATTGALEGAASIGLPTEVDINSLPESSPTRQQAIANLSDPDYAKRVALAGAVSGTFGALGGVRGYASTRPVRKPPLTPPPSAPPAASHTNGVTPPPVPPKMRTPYELPDGTTVKRLANGQWQGIHPGTKKWSFIKKPDISGAKVGQPEPYARGGLIGYADSGVVRGDQNRWDLDDRWNALSDPFPSELDSLRTMPSQWNAQRRMPPSGEFPDSPPPEENANPYAPERMNSEVAGKGGGDAMSYAPQQRQSLADNPWMALLNAGLGTMASAGQRDARGLPMSPLAAIGHGGQQGIKTLQEQREAAMKQQGIDQRAQQLAAEVARHQRAMTETERHNAANEARQKESLDFQKTRMGVGLFDPETVNMMAEQAIAGDKSVFANLGRGISGPQNIVQVRNRMNELAKERGYKGSDIAAMNANFTAQTAAARTAAQREANISTAVEEAKGTFPLALAASGNLPRTDWTPINRLMAAVRTGTSTPEQAEFALAHQAVITAYSQAMSRTGVNTVHAQERAEKAFSDVQGHESYERAIQQLEREMAVAVAAPEKARQMILNRISGKTEEHAPPTPMPGKKVEYTGRTATNPKTGAKLRETKSGDWVE